MRGIRRFCVGIATLALAWSQPTVQAQPEPRYADSTSQQQPAAWSPAAFNSHSPQSPAPPAGPYGMRRMAANPSQQSPSGQPGPYYQPGGYPPPGPGSMGGPPPGGQMPGAPLRPDPGLDMFRYGYQQTINKDGLWYKDMRPQSRKMTGRVEYIIPVYADNGGALFGNPGIHTDIIPTDEIPPFYLTTPRNPGDVTDDDTSGSYQAEQVTERYFPVRDFGEMFDTFSGSGIRLDLGVEYESGAGWVVEGWYGGEATDTYQRGAEPIRSYTPVPEGDPFTVSGNDPLYLFELNALTGGLSIDNGSGVADTIAFDTLFRMDYSVEAWGTGVQFYRPAIAEGDGYRIRPVLGLRYVDLQEGFRFRGLDSGAEYEFINFNDIDYEQEFETLNNFDFYLGDSSETGETGLEGRPVPDTFNSGDVDQLSNSVVDYEALPTNPYEVRVGASNQVRAAGPEIGLEAEMGGDNTQLTFQAVAGLTATQENLKLNGFGLYNHFLNNVDPDGDDTTPDGGGMGTGTGGLDDADTRFSEEYTHVSPLVDLSVRFESRLFQYVPGLNQLQFFNDAQFATSYGFLYVGNISRPQKSVDYKTFPINPSISTDREGWTMQQWSFGLTWER